MRIDRKNIIFSLQTDIIKKLKELAGTKGLTLSELLRRIIDDYLENFGE